MKKKIYFLIILLLIIGFFVYKFIYKEHRDISTENASIVETTSQIYSAFSSNESEANSKYLDKTIEVKGLVTSVDKSTKSVVIDSKLNAIFQNELSEDIIVNDSIIVKGRLVGFDSLLDELQMDQCTKK
ncbi:OB-fold protein [Flavobacterium capsici]|uniref:tRNA_anti-like n=1 Tax=Flavobacterium capsici TaxID=3075618 RepID=A0AA96F2T4_9FLAO|nr:MULTISPECIES: hypothetical protein [unclassified Flavobacterium]WNM18816.1 hypothetical protein RN608_12480 [Flavobacterium sp. PMR2A8]WNM22867.1 hypothetical protein RN605_05780 [Flavobacterium sp. PMTSA4]